MSEGFSWMSMSSGEMLEAEQIGEFVEIRLHGLVATISSGEMDNLARAWLDRDASTAPPESRRPAHGEASRLMIDVICAIDEAVTDVADVAATKRTELLRLLADVAEHADEVSRRMGGE